ncbi:C4-dicarboxylate ABC transporter [Synergistales bacterium]|nr:C4-dicarboxylate ABC transporter [Synergistales bacterium]
MRKLTGFWKIFIAILSTGLVLFHLYTAGFGMLPDLEQRTVHLAFTITMAFLLMPASKKDKGSSKIPIYDIVFAALSVAACAYILYIYEIVLWKPLQWVGPLDYFFAVTMVLLVLEASRRAVGLTFPIMALIFFAYAYWGRYFPSMWSHRGMSLNFIFQTFYHTTTGIWGTMIGISSTMLAMFGIFGAVLSATGGSQTFIKMGSAVTGKSIGGTGKVAVIASALFGMISGSAAANVVATGTFTIPMMKKSGYNNEWAAAVCAVGATGGLIMPPIMGAGAFIMSQLIGIPYITIAKSAVPTAFLYYFGTLVCVHYFSKKNNIRGEAEKEKIHLTETLIVLFPIVVFIIFMALRYTVTAGAFYASLVAIAVCLLVYFIEEKTPRPAFQRFGKLCKATTMDGASSIVSLATLLAGSQVVITLVNMTGFGVKLASVIVSIGQNYLFVCLLLSMVVCIIMGMGLPVTAAYVLAAAVLIPALTKLDVSPLVAHLFVFYFSTLGNVTPPVCAAVYLSAGLAEANWLSTGWLSCLLALPAFIIPYTFAYDSAFLLIGSISNMISAILTATIGVFFVGMAVAGFINSHVKMFWRCVMFGGGAVMIIPDMLISVIGLAFCVVAYILSNRTGKIKPSEA